MIKDFYIFRHGETDLNIEQRWQGQKFDVELNEKGISQAYDLANKIKPLGLEVIFSSPLKRALKTAEIASKETAVPLFIKNELKEGNFGVMEGLTREESILKYKDTFEKWMSFDEEFLDVCFEGGETKRQMLNRFFGVLANIAQEDYKKIGVSAHGSLILNMMAKLGKSLDKIHNAEVFHIQYINGEWVIKD